jgi:hypothetical protein
MKTVVVFDTEDPKGMEATYKIVDHLSQQFLAKRLSQSNSVSYRKIKFIKMLREYGKQVEEGKLGTNLMETKRYAEEIFERDADRWEA